MAMKHQLLGWWGSLRSVHPTWITGVAWLLLVAGLSGCTGGLDGAMARLKRQPIADVVPGVTSPAERIAALNAVRERAGRADPAEQARIAADLAAQYAGEEDPGIRAEIVRAVAACRGPQAAELLAKAVGDTAVVVRSATCDVLGQRGDAEAANLLAGVLASDLDDNVRMAAAQALGKTRDAAAVAALGEALEDHDPAMQYLAVQSLRQITGQDLGGDVNQWRQYVQAIAPRDGQTVAAGPGRTF